MNHMDQEPLDLAAAMALLREARAEVAALREAQTAKEEAEGRCCPEDVGFEEWISVLKQQNAALREALEEANNYIAQLELEQDPNKFAAGILRPRSQ